MEKRRTPLFVLILLLAISAVSILGTALFVKREEAETATKGKTLKVVASFYPVYISALNVTDGVEGVELSNLTEPTTGCLHDYTLTPKDMKTLSKADVLLVNGGGIENFVADVAKAYPKLKIVDISKDLKVEDHDHSDTKEHSQESDADTEDHDHEHDQENNAHYWMSLPLYRQQVKTMATELAKIDSVHASQYEANGKTYDGKLAELAKEEENLKGRLSHAVVFHEAFSYFCNDLGCQVEYTLDLDEERQVSAGEVRDTLNALKTMDPKVVIAEETYGKKMAERMKAEVGASIIYLDPLTRGQGNYSKDAYLDGMRENLNRLAEGLKQIQLQIQIQLQLQ